MLNRKLTKLVMQAYSFKSDENILGKLLELKNKFKISSQRKTEKKSYWGRIA